MTYIMREQISRMGEMRNGHTVSFGTLKLKCHLGGGTLGLDKRMILKWMLKKLGTNMWIGGHAVA
jgi:hypothetical protein